MESQAIYGDIFFIINFSMDFLALFLAGKILRRKMKLSLMCLAAALGGVYSVLRLVFVGHGAVDFAINIVILMLMCFIAFKWNNWKSFTLSCVLFVGMSFFLGGAMTAFYNILNQVFGQYPLNTGEQSAPIELWHLALLAAAGAAVALIWGRLTYSGAKKPPATVKITFNERTLEVVGLVDSGNLLHEPISRRPVIMLTRKMAFNLLGEEVHHLKPDSIAELGEKTSLRVRLVPVDSVGGRSMIVALIPDSVSVNDIEKEACLGIDQTENGDFGGHQALVPALLTE